MAEIRARGIIIKQSDYGEGHRNADCIYGRIRDS